MNYLNTYDEKIMNFDIDKGYEAFISMFEADEVEDMRRFLDREYGIDYYEDLPKEEARKCIIVDYVKEWLCDNIRDVTIYGTEHLFNIVYKVF